ncbi:LLM class flavin-dependent oxidoreductase [Bradyrhizobium sp. LHD-71]|uniref:LLM class flavin-dependent oxidoreductase n=1 Tax=Bradyrhizobium sp. LHD-71 TaxID=3072141 RepID=UPI00280F2AB4|nr:LLM class flavin-dependent oxidoreductase [Bradyrhizobium sp. LHD-71]MDQ8727148.1 LLM class flavin-dependent oxidoreductase [Bradyrhizobium sp. LHD-71]
MRFGLFDHMDRSGEDTAVQYENRLQILEACDRAGFYGYHLAEHHGTPLGLAPSPSVFLAAAAQRTRSLRLGALVFTLSLYHPLRILDEICMLDHLSKGRLDVGIGRGISPIELGFFDVDPADAPDIFQEVTEILFRGFTCDVLSHRGKHYSFENVPIPLHPLQQPMPPLWYGLGRPESLDWVAERGINIIGNGPAAMARKVTDRYRSIWQASGRSDHTLPMMGMSRHMIIAETDAEARALARPAYQQWIDNLLLLWRQHNVKPTTNFPEDFEAADAAGVCLVGSLATVRDKLRAQVSEAGVNYLLCRVAFGNLPKDASLRTIELVRREIMPMYYIPTG